jgi:hypothetical protein
MVDERTLAELIVGPAYIDATKRNELLEEAARAIVDEHDAQKAVAILNELTPK